MISYYPKLFLNMVYFYFHLGYFQIDLIIKDNLIWNLNQYFECWHYLVNKFDQNWRKYDENHAYEYLKEFIQ